MQGLYKKFSTWHSMVGACLETPSCIFQTLEPRLKEIDVHQEQTLSVRANKRDSASDIVIQTFIIKWRLLGRADSFYFNYCLHPVGTVSRNTTGKVVHAQLRVRIGNQDNKHLARLIKIK